MSCMLCYYGSVIMSCMLIRQHDNVMYVNVCKNLHVFNCIGHIKFINVLTDILSFVLFKLHCFHDYA